MKMGTGILKEVLSFGVAFLRGYYGPQSRVRSYPLPRGFGVLIFGA